MHGFTGDLKVSEGTGSSPHRGVKVALFHRQAQTTGWTEIPTWLLLSLYNVVVNSLTAQRSGLI